MTKKQGRLLVYQLVQARKALQQIWKGEGDAKEIAASVAYQSIGIAELEVEEFFATPEGERLARDFKL